MHVEFSIKALDHLKRIIDSHFEYCGELSAIKFSGQVDDKIRMLLRFPESGHPEPLLKDRKKFYRAKIINRRYKLIYYVDGEVIRLSAVWDIRMNPARLVNMI